MSGAAAGAELLCGRCSGVQVLSRAMDTTRVVVICILTHNDEFLFERYPPMPQEAPSKPPTLAKEVSNGSFADMI